METDILSIYWDAILEFSRQHPFISMGIAIVALYLIKEPIGSLLTGTKSFVDNVSQPSQRTLKKFRDDWSKNATQLEQDFTKRRGQGVLTSLLGSALFLGAVLLLVLLNFSLILRPLQDIVPTGEVFGYPLAMAAAIAILALEFVAGVIFLYAMGASDLVPIRRDSSQKNWPLMVVGFLAMLTLALSEAGLAIFRDDLIQLDANTRRVATGAVQAVVGPAEGGVQGRLDQMPMWVQAALGFLLPWAVMAAVLPVEAVLQTAAILFRRIGAVVVWVPETIFFAIEKVVGGAVDGTKALWELVTKPVDVFFKGLRPILEAVAPKLFKRS